jgi:hypothetical protein
MLTIRALLNRIIAVSLFTVLTPHALEARTPVDVVFIESGADGGVLTETINGGTPITWGLVAPTPLPVWALPVGVLGSWIAPDNRAILWTEPSEPGLVNLLRGLPTTQYGYLVGSDFIQGSIAGVLTILGDGDTYQYNTGFPIEVQVDDLGTFLPANITFYDRAGIDGPSVPDAQSTLPLFAFACLSLVWLGRYLSSLTVAASVPS